MNKQKVRRDAAATPLPWKRKMRRESCVMVLQCYVKIPKLANTLLLLLPSPRRSDLRRRRAASFQHVCVCVCKPDVLLFVSGWILNDVSKENHARLRQMMKGALAAWRKPGGGLAWKSVVWFLQEKDITGLLPFQLGSTKLFLLFCQRSSVGVSLSGFLLIFLVMSSNCMWLEPRRLFPHLFHWGSFSILTSFPLWWGAKHMTGRMESCGEARKWKTAAASVSFRTRWMLMLASFCFILMFWNLWILRRSHRLPPKT